MLLKKNNNNITVSICVPTFKQTEYLKRTLNSIMIQNYQDYEVIITDDSPGNEVEELINNYDFQGRLKYYKNKTIKGAPENWNESVKHAKGKYIKILHHDDWFINNESLGRFVNLLENKPDIDFAFCASQACNDYGDILYTNLPNMNQIRSLYSNSEILFLGNFIGAPSATIYKRSVRYKFDKNLKYFVDMEFYIKILLDKNNFVYSDEPLINITSNGKYQVTNLCINNKEIELFESLYLYSKIRSIKIRIKYLQILFGQFIKYKTFSINDIPKKEKLIIAPEIKMLMLFSKIKYKLRIISKIKKIIIKLLK